MSKQNQTGHTMNVANMGEVINQCKGYGAEYQPSNPAIAIVQLEASHSACEVSVTKTNLLEATYSKLAGIRRIAFKPLSVLATRIVNSFSSCKASADDIAKASSVARKIKGERAGKKNEEDEESNNISVSQMGYDNRINNFERLVQIVKLEPKYNPNEEDLKVTTLEALHAELKLKNEAARNAGEPLDNARLERDALLYAEDTGLVSLAADVKNYVSSVYTTTGAKFKLISSIPFTRPKKK